MKIFGIKFFTIAFASCIFTLKECMHLSIYVVFCKIKLLKKNPTILLKGFKVFNDKIVRKLPLVILTDQSFEHCKVFGVHKARKKPEIIILT